MIKYIYDEESGDFLRSENRTPKHDEDLCENCGRCLHCYGRYACDVDGDEEIEHEWVEYIYTENVRENRNERRREKGWND